MTERYIVIGDVHGCTAELSMLIEKLAPTKDDHIIWAGDLVDKGPDSAGVVKIARILSEEVPTTLVEGNHENKHRRFRTHMSNDAPDLAFRIKDAEVLYKITKRLSKEDIEFLDSAVLYALIPEYEAIVVHGGIPPTLAELPPSDMAKIMSGKKKRWFLQMLMLRFVTEKGHMVSLGKETKTDSFWAEIYDGRFGLALFGHQPYSKANSPVVFEHAIGLDLGCVFGNKLAAAVFKKDGMEFVTVDAVAKYAESFFEAQET